MFVLAERVQSEQCPIGPIGGCVDEHKKCVVLHPELVGANRFALVQRHGSHVRPCTETLHTAV